MERNPSSPSIPTDGVGGPMSVDPPPPSLDSSSQKNKKTPGSDISSKGPSTKKSRTFEGKSSVIDDGDCDMTSEDIEAALPIDKEMDVACEELDTSEVTVRLPVPSDNMFEDISSEDKQMLLEKRNLSSELQIRTSVHPGVEMDVETLIKASRILHLNDIEFYFVEDDDDGPFSPRNELLSLNAVFSSINCAVSDAKSDGKKALQEIILKKMDEFSCQYSDSEAIIEYDRDGEELLEWGNSHGMTAKLKISRRTVTGRGAEASENIGVGDIVLEVPNCLIISEDNVQNSSMYAEADLANVHDISSEELLMLWCMKERRNPSSDFERRYFQALPNFFRSGLSFGEIARKKLWPTPLGRDLVETTKLYPHILPPYSVDSFSKSLKFHALRPCNKGEQCYISYGNLTSYDLVKVYGFLPKDFHEIFEELCARKLYHGDFIQTYHMMRGNWFSKSGKLPASLLNDLYAFFEVTKGDKSEDRVSKVREALDAIHARLRHESMSFCFGGAWDEPDSDDDEVEVDNSPPREEPEWDVKLAEDYKWLMMCNMDAVLLSCKKSLEDWEIKPSCSS